MSQQLQDLDRDELIDHVQEQQRQLELLEGRFETLVSIVTGDYDLAVADMITDDGLIDRGERIENGELDATEIISANDADLRIQQLARDRRNGTITDDSDKNHYRASVLWGEYHDWATEEYGKLKLTRKQASKILDIHDLPSDRSTTKRVMEWTARFSNPHTAKADPDDDDNILNVKKRENSLVLVADTDDYYGLADAAKTEREQVASEVADEVARLETAELMTDD